MSGYSTTPNYNLRKPIVGADQDLWGGDWNINADTLDTQIKARADSITSIQASLTTYLPLAGGVLTGTLTLAGDPTLPLQSATKRYTDTMLPLAGGTMNGALNAPLLNIATADLTKALQITPQDDLPADIRIVDELGFVAVIIGPDGTINASKAAIDTVTPVTVNASGAVNATTALTLPNTTLYEIADGANHVIVQDDFGFVALIVEANGIVDAGTMTANNITVLQALNLPGTSGALTGTALVLANFSITDIADGRNDVLFGDDFGFIAFGILGIDGSLLGGGGSGGSGGGTDDPNSFYPSLLTARDALATAQSMAVRDNTNSKVATPIWTYNHIISYGQSLSLGFTTDPRLSTNEGLDNLCLGSRPAGVQADGSAFFTPAVDGNLHPLDSTAGTELPVIGATNELRKLQLRWRGLASDATRRLIVNGCGQGGQSIEQLSKGATPELYQQIPSLITQTKAAVTAIGGGATYGVVAVYFIQGEANYTAGAYDHTQAGYLAKWEQLKSDLSTDIMGLTGQQYPPAFITVQTSSQWDATGDICAIGNAQLQAATTTPYGDYMASPYYHTPNTTATNGHLNADGYRWIGLQAGHVMHKVLDRGEGWLPMYVTRASFRGSQVLLECHTPEPPIQKQSVYSDVTTLVNFPDCGFEVADDLGALSITSVRLLNSTILLTVNRTLNASLHPWVQYADNGLHGGNGNICDSDAFSALDNFTQTSQPYPMWNFLVAFRASVVSDV